MKKSGTKSKVIILVLERQTGGSLRLTGQAVQITVGLPVSERSCLKKKKKGWRGREATEKDT